MTGAAGTRPGATASTSSPSSTATTGGAPAGWRRRAAPAAGRAARRRRQFLPPQHGAWAMLAVPYVAGLVVAGVTWLDLPLAGAWLSGYLLSYYLFLALKSRRPGRYRTQLLGYAVAAVPLGVVVALARPAVLVYAPAYAALLGVNAWYAWRRRERALCNDLAAVAQCCLIVFVVAAVAGLGRSAVLGAFLACAAYFAGTTFYIKTMIRERGNPVYVRWSVCYHLLAFAFVAWLSPLLAGLFGWLLIRAWLLPDRGLTPLRTGLIEIGNCVLLLVVIALAWA